MLLLPALKARSQSVNELSAGHRRYINEATSDTARANRLVKYAIALFEVNTDSAYAVAHEALALSQRKNFTYGIGRSNQMISQLALFSGLFDSSQRASLRALDAYRRISDSENMARVLTGMGYACLESGKLDSAVGYFLSSIETISVADSLVKAHPYNGLSLAFSHMGQPEKALYYNLECGRLYALRKDTDNLVKSLINRAGLMEESGQLVDAAGACREVIRLSDLSGYDIGRFIGRTSLGDLLSGIPGKADSARMSLQEAEAIMLKDGITVVPLHRATLYTGLAKVYYSEHNYLQAKRYMREALQYVSQSGQVSAIMDAHLLMTRIQLQLGDKAASLASLNQYILYRDSLQRKDVADKVTELELKYKSLEKDKSLADQQLAITTKDLELRKKSQQLILLGGGLLLVVAIAAGLFVHFRQKQQLQAQQMQLMQKESELAMAQAAMEGEEKERARIARNLHDGAGSILSGVKLYLSSLGNQHIELANSSSYHNSLALLGDAVTEIRDTSHNLMPRLLFEEGIEPAAGAYCEKLGRNNSLEVEYQSYGIPRRFHPSSN